MTAVAAPYECFEFVDLYMQSASFGKNSLNVVAILLGYIYIYIHIHVRCILHKTYTTHLLVHRANLL